MNGQMLEEYFDCSHNKTISSKIIYLEHTLKSERVAYLVFGYTGGNISCPTFDILRIECGGLSAKNDALMSSSI